MIKPSIFVLPDADAAQKIGGGWTNAPRAVVFVVNTDWFFLTHRSSWAIAFGAAGSDVTVIAKDTGYGEQIRGLGITFVDLDLGRENINVLDAVATSARLVWALTRTRPDVVFLVATAAYTLGWPAALILPRAKVIRVFAGAGRVLADERPSWGGRVVKGSLSLSARFRNVESLFQLESQCKTFVEQNLAVSKRSTVITGTGIDVEAWYPLDETAGDEITVAFASRLFLEKGVYEFVRVAERLRGTARFVLVGAPDDGVTTSVSKVELARWSESGIVEYAGQSRDMLRTLRSVNILLFPSRHPEGTPRILIEAASLGIAIVASDQEGCRAVTNNGAAAVLLPPDDFEGWVRAVDELIGSADRRRELGELARSHALRMLSLDHVLRLVLQTAS